VFAGMLSLSVAISSNIPQYDHSFSGDGSNNTVHAKKKMFSLCMLTIIMMDMEC